jgi:predicted nucleotide-binding protein
MMANRVDSSNVFVVHGRNLRARDALVQFLRALGLHPIEWSEAVRITGQGSPHVGDVLDAGLSICQAVVVLMTPDDIGQVRDRFRHMDDVEEEWTLRGQPRLNVVFEAGMALGRFPDRTIIVQLGRIRPFSDLSGRHVIRMDSGSEKRHQLRERLEAAGCSVRPAGTDWLGVGSFSEPIKEHYANWDSNDADRDYVYLLDPYELDQVKNFRDPWDGKVLGYVLLSAIQHNHDVSLWLRRNLRNPNAIAMLVEMIVNSPHRRPSFRAAKILEIFDSDQVNARITELYGKVSKDRLSERARLLLDAVAAKGVVALTETTTLLDPWARSELLRDFRSWPQHASIRLQADS